MNQLVISKKGFSLIEVVVSLFILSISVITIYNLILSTSVSSYDLEQRYLAKDPLWVGIQKQIQDVFVDCIQLYMNSLQVEVDFPAKYSFEEYRVKYYNNNGHDQFKDHVDVGDYNSARRFLVMFLYLNNVSVGGETSFPRLGEAIAPQTGRVLMFPATWQYRHAGLPPMSDNKYIVGTYLHYL